MKEIIAFCALVFGFYALSQVKTTEEIERDLDPQTKEERDAAYKRGPKYNGPNEFTLKSGCKFRSTQGAMFVRDPKDHKVKWMLVVNQPLNNWTKKCSEAPRFFASEEDVKTARYK